MISFNNKILDAISICLKDKVNLFVMEGTARSAKTATAIISFFEAVQQSDEALHCIAARNNDAILDNLLQDENHGLLNIFPDYCQLKQEKIGSYFVEVLCDIKGKPKRKKILLANYSDTSKWKNILGKSIGVFLIDEVNIADKAFIEETFARQFSADRPLQIWTLNGDVPEHYIYQEYINKCKIIGQAPASIQAEMADFEKTEGWYYMHWTMWDNPIMTEEKIARAMRTYPVGSFYYITKVLGERGSSGELIFAEYMNPQEHIIQETEEDDKKKYTYAEYMIGLDIGATRAKNSMTLVGFNYQLTDVGVLDNYTFAQVGYDKKKPDILAKVLEWQEKYDIRIKCISVDSAEQNFIYDLKVLFAPHRIQVIGSYKATIKERCDMMIILLSHFRIKFSKQAIAVFKAYQNAKWAEGKIGKEREDNNDVINDIMDSCEYALTTRMKDILSKVRT